MAGPDPTDILLAKAYLYQLGKPGATPRSAAIEVERLHTGASERMASVRKLIDRGDIISDRIANADPEQTIRSALGRMKVSGNTVNVPIHLEYDVEVDSKKGKVIKHKSYVTYEEFSIDATRQEIDDRIEEIVDSITETSEVPDVVSATIAGAAIA